jgi:hypothetical protein
MILPLSLPPGLRPGLLLKCPVAGLVASDSDTDTQPKLALALGGYV